MLSMAIKDTDKKNFTKRRDVTKITCIKCKGKLTTKELLESKIDYPICVKCIKTLLKHFNKWTK